MVYLRKLSTITAAVALVFASAYVQAEESKQAQGLHEPVYRVTKQESPRTTTAAAALVKQAKTASDGQTHPAGKSHPLDLALTMAANALKKSQNEISDYTGILVKRERVSGRLNDEQYMLVKVRNEKLGSDNQVATPFSVYLKFLKPSSIQGREVIYINGENDGKLIAHEGGLKGKLTPSLYLDPNGALAMMGQRYPITDIGIEKLCVKLLERGQRDRLHGACSVDTVSTTINRRKATRIDVVHPEQAPHLDFHVARIYVDKEYGLPVRYEAYDWPKSADAKVTKNELIEEFTYVRLKFNVGLTDMDFDPKNPKYNMK